MKQQRPLARSQQGFTLIELIVSVAILTIMAAFALPAYRGYVETSERGVLVTNMSTIEVFQEDFRLRNGRYAVNLPDRATITATIGWEPRDDGTATYSIGNSAGASYQLTGTSDGLTVCIEFPAKVPCP